MKIPGSRESSEGGQCLHSRTKWHGPFDLKLGDVEYTYKQKKCKKCGKLLENSKPKKKK